MKLMMSYLLSITAQIVLVVFLILAVNKTYGNGVAEAVGVMNFGALAFSS